MDPRSLVIGSRLARGRWVVVAMIVVAVLGQAALDALGSSFGSRSPGELAVYIGALLAATVLTLPALAVVLWLDRRERESPWLYAFALAWGMLGAAGLSLLLNSAALQEVYETLVEGAGGAAAGVEDEAVFLVAVFFGPPVEEAAKGIALLLLAFFLRGQFFTVRDGIVFGLLVGLGFNLLEAPFYVMNGYADTGNAPWGPQLVARFVFFGLNGHAIYTALFGAGVGYAIQHGGVRGVLGAVGGAIAAVVAHMLNNALMGVVLGSTLAALGYPPEGDDVAAYLASIPLPAYWVAVAVSTVAIQWWAYLLLAAVAWRSGTYERRIIREQLASEIGRAITVEEYRELEREPRHGLRQIPGLEGTASRDLVTAQNKLAVSRARAVGRGRDPMTDPLVVAWRSEIDELRAAHVPEAAGQP